MPELLPAQSSPTLMLDFNTLEDLYSRYGRQAFGLALRILEDKTAAEQAIQEVFLRYWRQPDLYEPQNGPFLNWLLREVHCYCLDRLPANLFQPHNALLVKGPLSTEIVLKSQSDLGEASPGASRQLLARQALAGLHQEQREIVEMAYFKGLNHQQIARLTGYSAQCVRQQLTVGLVRLKRGMAQYNPV